MAVVLTQPKFACGLATGVTAGPAHRRFSTPLSDNVGGVFEVGSGADQVSRDYYIPLTIMSGVPTVIDLTALVNEENAAFGFTTIEALKITNLSKQPGEDVTVGGGTNPVIAAQQPLKAVARDGGTTLYLITPITVDGTHKLLQITAAAGTAVAAVLTILGR
ncbi:MAG TPA: hypothetical protein VF595_06135 [Tepidisphaeraceae bacterium]|jgi:hypothetical protein